MVVVTRWYGGIKLGAGGLVRAYGGARPNACAPRRAARWSTGASSTCTPASRTPARVHAALAAHGAERLDEAFDADGLRLRVRLPADRVDALAAQLRDATPQSRAHRGQCR